MWSAQELLELLPNEVGDDVVVLRSDSQARVDHFRDRGL